MEAFVEILFAALKKYAAELIAAILVSLSFWFLPPLRRLITGRKASEIRKQLKEARELERKKAAEIQEKLDEAQKHAEAVQDEARKQVEKTQQELNEAKKQVEKIKQEAIRKNETSQRELDEARKHAEAVQNEALKKNEEAKRELEEAKRQVEIVRQETLKQNEETQKELVLAKNKLAAIERAWKEEKSEQKEHKRILIVSVLFLLFLLFLLAYSLGSSHSVIKENKDLTETRAMEGFTSAQSEMGDRAYQAKDYYKSYIWYYVAYLGGNSNSERIKDLEGGWFSNGKLSSSQVKRARAAAEKIYRLIQRNKKK